jgi:N-terminal EH-domain containing protein
VAAFVSCCLSVQTGRRIQFDMSDWVKEPDSTGADGGEMGDKDRAGLVAARLKQIYKKSVLPCEQRYRYEYFYESPLLSDVEFDGACAQARRCVGSWLTVPCRQQAFVTNSSNPLDAPTMSALSKPGLWFCWLVSILWERPVSFATF